MAKVHAVEGAYCGGVSVHFAGPSSSRMSQTAEKESSPVFFYLYGIDPKSACAVAVGFGVVE